MNGHERVVTVDHDPRPFWPTQRRHLLETIEDVAAAKHNLASEDEVVVAAGSAIDKALAEALEGLHCNLLNRDPTGLGPARELSPGAVELAIGGEDAKRI